MKQGKATRTSNDRLLDVAAEIVRESVDFDLPMRQLAARAQVSLRTPYKIFGSKGGIIRALLKQERLEWRAYQRNLPPASLIVPLR